MMAPTRKTVQLITFNGMDKKLLCMVVLVILLHSIGNGTAITGYYDLNQPPLPCSDYEMMVVNTRQCVRRCPIVCMDGICYENDECPCADGYATSFEVGLICAADCLPGCNEAGGYCASPDLCICRKGKHYYFDQLAQRCRRRRPLDLCRGRCRYGQCLSNGQCVCAQGYAPRVALLGQMCVPICEQNCGPRAYCFAPNLCACKHKHHHYNSEGRCVKDDFIDFY